MKARRNSTTCRVWILWILEYQPDTYMVSVHTVQTDICHTYIPIFYLCTRYIEYACRVWDRQVGNPNQHETHPVNSSVLVILTHSHLIELEHHVRHLQFCNCTSDR